MFKLDKSSWFYKNCKTQRKRGAKICGECPFREWIELQEKKDVWTCPNCGEDLLKREGIKFNPCGRKPLKGRIDQ